MCEHKELFIISLSHFSKCSLQSAAVGSRVTDSDLTFCSFTFVKTRLSVSRNTKSYPNKPENFSSRVAKLHVTCAFEALKRR